MKSLIRSGVLGIVFAISAAASHAASPIDCNCVTNLPGLTVTCPGTVPDLCALAANCFGTNMMPGSCTQNFPPGMQFPVGTYSINLQVQDLQSNYYSCAVPFVVNPQVPTPKLAVSCPTNKTVECGSGWSFDSPVILSSCCGVTITTTDNVISNGTCSQILERTWQITDGCGNTATCSQVVTTQDTTPPGRQCGANLVPNPSFENFTNCPNSISLFDYASPWFTPTDGTSDLYSPCAGPSSYVSVPTNVVGVQIPNSGQAYAGAAVWSVYGLNTNNTYRDYREYLEVPLLAPLIGGQRYQVSFYVSRADNYRYAIAELGACFTKLPLITNGYSRNFAVVPQIENTNLLTSTNTWMLVQGTFIANGTEAYMTIGNFRTDANTTYTNANPAAPWPDYAYYYFDDVSVTMLCDPLTNKVVQCGDPWVFDFNPTMAYDNCTGMGVTVTTTTTTNGFCPKVIQRDWQLADACGNTNVLSQTVTIVDTNPPVLLCAGGANLVPNPQFENYSFCPWFFGQVPDASPWFDPTVATPDYLNSCATFAPVSVPNNYFGNQTAFSGNGYMGAYVYSVWGTNPPPGYREYIEAPLLAPLQAGTTYQVSFRVSLADYSGWAIAEIGAHFSVGPILGPATQSVLNYVPQVVNPSANLLASTNTWMLIQGTFTAAGGEDHITLGNFLDDASTTAVPAAGTNISYYYYDDVSVVPLCNFTNKTVPCGEPWSFDTPLAFDGCSADFLSTTILSTTTNGTCPQTITRVWNIADACGNSITATQAVTVVDTTPPTVVCSGVNLVPNPSFENFAPCPVTISSVANASPWYAPTDGTPDYYNACATLGSTVSVPTNFPGVQNAFDGQAYCGAYVYNYPGGNDPTNSYREYLQTPLLAPLVAGQAYAVSFYVSQADNYAWAVAQIGAHFSVGAVTNYVGPGGMVLPVVPQIENPSTNLLTSTNSWMQISGVYVASGGEDHITLGNFHSDAATTAALGAGPYGNSGYYYFDQVSVVALCQASNKMIPCGAPWTFDPPMGFDTCSGTNVTITVASTVTNSLCPLRASRSWWLSDLCGNSNLWTQSVIATTNGSSLTVNCGCLQDTSLNLLTTNACSAVIPNLSVLTNSPCIVATCGNAHISQSPPAGTVVGTGSHPITVTIYDCAGHTNICVLPFNVFPAPPIINCPTNLYVLTCSNSMVVNFSVTASGNNGPVVCSPPSGTAFPMGTNLVICTATNNCGGVATCVFNVVVRPQRLRFGCFTKVIGVIIINNPPGIMHLPALLGGGVGVDFFDLPSNGQDGVRFDFGPAQKFTFSTVLDFAAPDGAGFDLAVPDAATGTSDSLLRFRSSGGTGGAWSITKAMSGSSTASYRSIAIGTNGELFSSFTQSADALGTNTLLKVHSMGGSTSAVVTVTLDCRSGEIALEFPNCSWTSDNARKGWDGCIYGNGPRGSQTDKTARLILTPLGTPPTQITNLDLITTNLTTMAFDNPAITVANRKWGDGHVTLMKAYDDGEGMEFVSLGDGGGVNFGLGYAESFRTKIHHFETGDIPTEEQFFRIAGSRPSTILRPVPTVFNARFAQNTSGTGGIDCSADFAEWGVSNVTIQLWNGTTLVAESNHVPASLDNPLVTLSGFPTILDCPAIGMLRVSDTNPIIVTSGFDCGTLGCVGTELRILPEFTVDSLPPTAFTGISCLISDGMDDLIYNLQTTPACTPVPLNVNPGPNGITLDWQGDGFRLQGAESLAGPWYDLGVESPVVLPAGYSMRFYRLICD